MATVYLAHDLKHDRQVAVKVLRPELAAALGTERFVREIRLTAQLSHPHILPLLDSGAASDGTSDPELLYYVMPFIEGESLRKALDRDRVLDLDRAIAITRQVAGALDFAHRQGVVHRDIKPENILLHHGEAMVADFGIAVAISAAGGGRLTSTGVALGTPVYMSPEQIFGERELDGRTDIYALGCLLYEMLAGEPPFTGPTMQAITARRLSEPAPHIRATAATVPAAVDAALQKALDRDRDHRFDSATEFVDALGGPATSLPAGSDLGVVARLVRRPIVLIPSVAILAIVAALIVVPARRRAAREAGRAMLPRIAHLADSGRYGEAFSLAVTAERSLGADSGLARLLARVSDRISVATDPPGARVRLQPFTPDSAGRLPEPVDVGVTPIRDRRVARGDHRLVIEKAGFAAVERLASTGWRRAEATTTVPNEIAIAVTLPPADSAPDRMVFVPGGSYTLSSPDLPTGMEARLSDYWLDRYEVTNEEYQRFIRTGRYASLAPDRPIARLVDRTGLAGPRDWVGQEYPTGTASHPVTGVSWVEADAFCAAAGKQLPTVFQWEKASRNGATTVAEGTMMPWGYAGPGESPAFRANFGGKGTVAVDAHPFGMSAFGAYAMAGNAKEWTRSPMGKGYAVTGGSWEDPMYLYSEYGDYPPTETSRALGFRCARLAAGGAGGDGAARIPIEQRTPQYHPVDQKTFESLLTHYRYDRRPLNPRIIAVEETADWTRQKIRLTGVAGDSVLVYLYLPRRSVPPYQTMVYLPSSGAYFGDSVSSEAEWLLGPNIKAGRALMGVVLKGMTEREWGPGYQPPEPQSVRFRDRMVLHATEMRLGLDYLETRPEIDPSKFAYIGLSLSGGSGLPLAGVDDRFRSVILIGGGIDERMQPTLPEASNINFAPYIKPPKLLLNGRNDEEHPYYTRALPLWNLLRPPKKLVLVEGAGHSPPLEARVPAVNAWLDSTLGRVRR